LIAFGLTFFAGLSTAFGSALTFLVKHTNTKLLSVALGFSAGVMIYVSLVELLPEARECFAQKFGKTDGLWLAVLVFFAGICFIAVIDRLIPSFRNPHEVHKVEELSDPVLAAQYGDLYRTGIFVAIAIALHNFAEGFATFAAALKDIKVGVPVAIAIAIHNIPEGVAVSIPVYYATGSRRKAFAYSLLSGLTEPLGALIAYALLLSFFQDIMYGIALASVAGIMVFISLDELLPCSRRCGEPHLALYGLVGGMALMALILLLF
jgi:ZIP family zinc transporter